MMPAWISSALLPPPTDRAVFVRFGSNMFDAGYSKWRKKWFMLGGGREEEIADPPLWFDRDAPDNAEADLRLIRAQGAVSARRSKAPVQGEFVLASPDSETLSKAVGGAGGA